VVVVARTTLLSRGTARRDASREEA
jgi:hypothetical protein